MTNTTTVFGLFNETTMTTDSFLVAEKFGKRHKDLLRGIDNILPHISDDFTKRNIALCSKINHLAKGKPQKYYSLTKDGFTMVAMSLTGKDAFVWKEAFIAEFNRLQEENTILKSIVWQVINDKAFLGQELGMKCAGIEKPRKFAQFIRENPKTINWLDHKGYFFERQVGKNRSDIAWAWSKEGFQWLLSHKGVMNKRVQELCVEERLNK